MGILPGSQIAQEAEEWQRKRQAESDGSARWCTCRKPVEGPTYMKLRSCRLCGKLLKEGK